MVIRYSKTTMEKMLKDFQNLCDNKIVKKMPYDDWKILKRMVENNRYLYLHPAIVEKGDIVYRLDSEKFFATKNWACPHLFFLITDGSFGYFLDIAWKTYPINAIKWADDIAIEKFEDKLSYYDIMTRAEVDNMANGYLDCSAVSEADAVKIGDYSTRLSTCESISTSQSQYSDYYTTTKTAPAINWADNNTVRIVGDVCCSKGDSVSLLVNTKVDKAEYDEALKDMYAKINEDKPMLNNEKEKNMFKFDFGSCADNHNIRMSMYGLAVKNRAGNWVSYDANSNQIMDVDILNFDSMNRYVYRVPVAIKDIAVGDMLIHNGRPVFVTEITEAGKIVVVDVYDGEEKMILPLRNMFGFDYATKVVSIMDMCGAPSADQPFGNMWMLALADSKDFDPMMLMLMNGGKMDMSNPMMMYMLMKDNKSKDDILPLLMMMNMNK